jgi:hypothetical protein
MPADELKLLAGIAASAGMEKVSDAIRDGIAAHNYGLTTI